MQKFSSYIVLFLFASVLAAQTPFSCDGKMYFFRADPNNSNGYLAYFDNYTTATTVTNLCPLPTNAHNGLAANPINNMLYYLEGQNLRSLDANCNSTIVCPSIGFSSLSGACDNYGRYWTINSTNALVAIDINTCAIVKGPFAGFLGALDIAYNLYDCHIYVNSGSSLLQVDTNGVTTTTYPLTFTPAGTYGGTAFGSNGLFYGVAGSNATGNLSVIDIANLTSALVHNFTDGPTYARSDMASFACVSVDAFLSATPTTGCAPLNVQFTDNSVAYPGPVNYWDWNFGDLTPNSSQQNPNHIYTNPGTYTVTLIVGTTTGCNMNDYDTVTTVITVTNGPNATVSQPVGICPGNSTTLTANGGGTYLWSTGATTASITVTPTATTTYSVTVTLGLCSSTVTTTVTVFPAANLTTTGATVCMGDVAMLTATGTATYLWQPSGQTTSSISTTPTNTTTYTVLGTSSDGCTVTATATVTVNALPVITASGGQACEGGSVILTATGGSSYLWSNGATSASITVATTATYTVVGTNAFGCTATAAAAATFFTSPTAAFTTDPSDLEPGVQTVQFMSTSTGATTWFWNFGDGNTSTIENPQHTYAQSGIYLVWLVVTNANGCIDSISMTVEIKPDWSIYLPNAFTPDGNGTNEIFYAYGTNILAFEMWIFDRWGKLIFTSTNMQSGWDGKVQGGASDALVQEDVYVWKVIITDQEKKEHRLVGHVTVVK